MQARRLVAVRALWGALSGSRRPGAPSTGQRLAALPRLVGATLSGRYPGLSRGRLALLAAGVAYLLSPVDLMPEVFLTIFGLGDDALVAAWLAGTVLAEAESFMDWEARERSVVRGEVVSTMLGR